MRYYSLAFKLSFTLKRKNITSKHLTLAQAAMNQLKARSTEIFIKRLKKNFIVASCRK